LLAIHEVGLYRIIRFPQVVVDEYKISRKSRSRIIKFPQVFVDEYRIVVSQGVEFRFPQVFVDEYRIVVSQGAEYIQNYLNLHGLRLA